MVAVTTPPPTPPPGAWQQPLAWVPPPPPRPVAPNGQPLAGFGDRFLAFLIDYLIYLAVSLIWTIPIMIWWFISVFNWMDQMQRDFETNDPYASQPMPGDMFGSMLEMYIPMFILMGASIVLGAAFTYLYFGEYQLSKDGQTVGKRVMKIKVIPVDPAQSLTRLDLVKRWALQWLVGMFVPLFQFLDGLWQLWDKPLQQCLHDKAAATVVVKVG